MKRQSLFSGKNKKVVSKCRQPKILHSMLLIICKSLIVPVMDFRILFPNLVKTDDIITMPIISTAYIRDLIFFRFQWLAKT